MDKVCFLCCDVHCILEWQIVYINLDFFITFVLLIHKYCLLLIVLLLLWSQYVFKNTFMHLNNLIKTFVKL